ncbi:MAG TPA: hypothetical protein VMW62_02090 [Chloroflexota bacterium]|nr:hypothetical protein [Chloroflexota bacterium]
MLLPLLAATVVILPQSIDNEATARKQPTTLKAQDFIDTSFVKQALQELGG